MSTTHPTRPIGGLALRPTLSIADMDRVETSVDTRFWAPCVDGCCLRLVGASDARAAAAALRRLIRSPLALAGVREIAGAVSWIDPAGRLVVVSVHAGRVTSRVAAEQVAWGHPVRPACRGDADDAAGTVEGGGRVVSIFSWM